MRPHGTRSRYINNACRCEPCRQAQSTYQRAWYERKRGQKERVPFIIWNAHLLFAERKR